MTLNNDKMTTPAIVTIIGMFIGLIGTAIGLMFKDTDKCMKVICTSVVVGLIVVFIGFGIFIFGNPTLTM